MKTLTTVIIVLVSYNVFASETFKYVDNDSDIPIMTSNRKPASVEPAKEQTPIEDPLKDWKPDEVESFDAFIMDKSESREQAYQKEVNRKISKKTSNLVNRMAEEEDETRVPNTVKKPKKKLKFKKKS